MGKITSAASSNFPKRSLSIFTSSLTESVTVKGVKLTMSAKRMVTSLCFSTYNLLLMKLTSDGNRSDRRITERIYLNGFSVMSGF